jgi:hypothetical protein
MEKIYKIGDSSPKMDGLWHSYSVALKGDKEFVNIVNLKVHSFTSKPMHSIVFDRFDEPWLNEYGIETMPF